MMSLALFFLLRIILSNVCDMKVERRVAISKGQRGHKKEVREGTNEKDV